MIQESTYTKFTLKLKYTVVDLCINKNTFARTVTSSKTVISDNLKSNSFTHVIFMLLHRLHGGNVVTIISHGKILRN